MTSPGLEGSSFTGFPARSVFSRPYAVLPCERPPSPGFVVLDSPITSYREGRVDEAEDEAAPEVQAAFWDNLAKWTKDEQVVLIENKEPTESARQLAHYVHFLWCEEQPRQKGVLPSSAIMKLAVTAGAKRSPKGRLDGMRE